MIDFNVTQHVPKFILRDKNGYALAKAIEAGMRIMNDTAQDGLDCVTNIDTMPEWRLDELADEYGILYDSFQSVETKRRWVANALDSYKRYGTPAMLLEYIRAAFDNVRLEEWNSYDGYSYHYRLVIDGEYDTAAAKLINKAIAVVGNVRSTCDGITYNAATADPTTDYNGAGVSGYTIVHYAAALEEEE